MELKRRGGESASAFLYRFSKKIQHSGVLREAKKRRHLGRAINKNKRKASAIYRENKKAEVERMKKLGKM